MPQRNMLKYVPTLFSVMTCNHKLLQILISVIKEVESSESDDDSFEEIILNRNIRRIRGK